MEENNCIEVYLNETLKEEQIRVPMLDTKSDDGIKYKYTTTIFEQPNEISRTLLDIIQNESKDTSYFIFYFYGFKTLLTKEEQDEILSLKSTEYKKLEEKLEKLYNKYHKTFVSLKRQLIEIIEFCIFNQNNKLNDLSPLDRFVVFINTHNIEDYPILNYNNFNKIIKMNKNMSNKKETEIIEILKDKDNNRYGVKEIYLIDNFYKLIYLELYFVLAEKTYLKKCKNCGKYFLSTNPAVVYCNNTYENNKTCREIGASKVFIKNLEKDEAYNLYRKIYKKKQALSKNKRGIFEIEYNKFRNQGKDKKDAYKLGEITKDEFIKWLKKQ